MSSDNQNGTLHKLPKGGSARIRLKRTSTSPSHTASIPETIRQIGNCPVQTKTRSNSLKPIPPSEPREHTKPIRHNEPTPPTLPNVHRGIPQQVPSPAVSACRKRKVPNKEHRDLRPFLFRYLIPLVTIAASLSVMTFMDPPTRTIAPKYSMEAFVNRVPYRYRGGFSRDFNDLNDIQLVAATALGIPPAQTRAEVARNPKLQPINCFKVIRVDSLTHSQALMVPEANRLLEEIGTAFVDRLKADQLPLYRPILTSATRTREDISFLRQGNGNASENSTHMHGTTFDLSWKRFDKVDPNDPRSLEPDELKHLLATILKGYHDQGRCYIKHERRQACFHITTRP